MVKKRDDREGYQNETGEQKLTNRICVFFVFYKGEFIEYISIAEYI